MTPANTPATPPAFPDTLLSLSKLTTSDTLSTSPGMNHACSGGSGNQSSYPYQRSPLTGQQQAAMNGHFGGVVTNHLTNGHLSNGHLGGGSQSILSNGQSLAPSKSVAPSSSSSAFLSPSNNHLFNHY